MNRKKRKASVKFKIIALVCFLAYIGVSVYTQQVNINDLNSRNGELEQKYEQAQMELARLEHQSEYMDTEKYVENVARDKFGLAYSGELILEPEN